MATLSHGAVALSGPGILVGVLIWLTQKEKSAYASGQGLQAAVYQLLGMILFVGLWIAWGIFYGISMIPMVLHPEQFEDAPPPLFWIALGSMAIPLVLMVIWGLYGLWGALRCWRGEEFRYAVLGKKLLGG
jgi:uncharacterized Tic20 family protein